MPTAGTITRLVSDISIIEPLSWTYGYAGSAGGRMRSLSYDLSPDGTSVAYIRFGALYVRNLATGQEQLASSNAAGQSGSGPSYDPVFSPDGTKIAFASAASGLVSYDGGSVDIFVKDLLTGAIACISMGAGGVQANGRSGKPYWSPDGLSVSFTSFASNLTPGLKDYNFTFTTPPGTGTPDVFVKLLGSDGLSVGSSYVGSAGYGARNDVGWGYMPDGSLLNWNGKGLVYRDPSFPFTDPTDQGIENLGVTPATQWQGGYEITTVAISADGSKIAFSGDESYELLAPSGRERFYLLEGGTLTRIANGPAQAAFSPDGQLLAFATRERLSVEDTNEFSDIYVRDLATGTVSLITRGANGAASNANSFEVRFSPAGDMITFASAATNLAGVDGGGGGGYSLYGFGIVPSLFTARGDSVDFDRLTAAQRVSIDAINAAAPDALYNGLAGNDVVHLPQTGAATFRPGLAWDIGRTFGGGAGNDQIHGSILGDRIDGGHGSDIINGGLGNDIITDDPTNAAGGSISLGAGTIDGGADFDTLDLTGASITRIMAGDVEVWSPGDVYIKIAPGSAVSVHVSANGFAGIVSVVNVEKIQGLRMVEPLFSDAANKVDFNALEAGQLERLQLMYDSGNYADAYRALGGRDEVYLPDVAAAAPVQWLPLMTFEAGGGDDKVWGGLLGDRIDGGAGVDRLFGGFGSDTLLGGADTDFLVGYEAFSPDESDTLDGGAGSDVFIIDKGDKIVRIDAGEQIYFVTDGVIDRFSIEVDEAKTYFIARLADGSSTTFEIQQAVRPSYFDATELLMPAELAGGSPGEAVSAILLEFRQAGGLTAASQFAFDVNDAVRQIQPLLGIYNDLLTGLTTDINREMIDKGSLAAARYVSSVVYDKGALAILADYVQKAPILRFMPYAKALFVAEDLGVFAARWYNGDFDGKPDLFASELLTIVADALSPVPGTGSLLKAGGALIADMAETLLEGMVASRQQFLIDLGRADPSPTAGRDVIIRNDGAGDTDLSGGDDILINRDPAAGHGVPAAPAGASAAAPHAETIAGGAGTDIIIYEVAGNLVIDLAAGTASGAAIGTDSLSGFENAGGGGGNDLLSGTDDINILIGGGGADDLRGLGGDDLLFGDEGDDRLDGGEGVDKLIGDAGSDRLLGGAAADQLDGGAGADRMEGGAGDDLYTVDSPSDVVVEAAGAGVDAVRSTVSHTLAANVENLTLTGTAAINATGNALANILIGNDAANDLSGGAGADTMNGRAGNDRYFVDHAGDTVIEATGGGSDRVFATASFALAAGQEIETLSTDNAAGTAARNLTGNEFANFIMGNAGANILSGKGGNDTLVGNAGNDQLNGGTGADYMNGGLGDDVFYVDAAGDQAFEAAGQGNDRVFATASFALAAGQEIETLSTDNAAGTGAINLTGNELVNFIMGNAGANILSGKGGADTLVGNAGNDQLNGGTGADYMNGGLGDDVFYVDAAGDQAFEAAGQGNDRVFAGVSFALAAGQEIETLSTDNAAGTVAINLTGNEFANFIMGNAGANILSGKGGNDTLVGNAGNDQLNGGTGADYMNGGLGDDVFYVDAAGDQAFEAAGQGNDRVFATASFALAAGQEIETLSTDNAAGTGAINLTGNELVNFIMGNAGANILNGKAGADTLVGNAGNDQLLGGAGADYMNGGLGDDVFYVDAAGDQAFEAAGQGNDRVFAGVSFALATGQEIETLSTDNAAGTGAINLTGNASANTIMGNAGANVLDGKAGSDVLSGFGGSDTFTFTTAPGVGNVDTIADFSAAADTIAIDNAVFAGLPLGALNANAFVVGAAAADAGDRIIYNAATGQLFFDPDGTGAGAQVQFATLSGAPAITAGDFTVI